MSKLAALPVRVIVTVSTGLYSPPGESGGGEGGGGAGDGGEGGGDGGGGVGGGGEGGGGGGGEFWQHIDDELRPIMLMALLLGHDAKGR